jgi:hypothetical protein
MNIKEVILNRLYNQQISSHRFKTVPELVGWLGALQAQDYTGSLWAMGLRLPDATDSIIEQSISGRKIIRSWPLRGTLHFVAASDIWWMLQLSGPGIIAGSKARLSRMGIDDSMIAKTRKVLIRALEGGKILTRKMIYQLLESNRIPTDTQRGMHILWRLALEGLICCGPREDKQPTYALLEDWVPKPKLPGRNEAITELAKRYFQSHGPATVHDFAWWSGLTIAEAKKGIELAGDNLLSEAIEGRNYWFTEPANDLPDLRHSFNLLPAFDEYLVAYKDRSISLDDKEKSLVLPGSGIINPVIISKGKVAGTWKRSVKSKTVGIEIKPFGKLNKLQIVDVQRIMKQYALFINKTLRL